MTVTLLQGDCREVLRGLPEAGVDSCVCDPPYGLGFMGKEWDRFTAADMPMRRSAQMDAVNAGQSRQGGRQRACADYQKRQARDMRAFQDWCELWAAEVYRVLKPGAHLVAFSGTRTYHRMVCAIEDAGFEVRDQLAWVYGSGFSKVGMLKNRHPELWCKCDGEQAAERDLRSVRETDVSQAEHSGKECGQVLFKGLQEPSTQERRTSRAESETGNGEQPGLERRALHGAGQGLCDGAEPLAPESKSERLCVRAHSDSRADAGTGAASGRGSPPHQPGSVGQPTGEPEGLRLASGALDGGALRDGGCCPRCGGISRAFDGFGGSLKPAWEPIVLARKPLIGTVAANVAAHGTGALNIDATRIPTEAGWQDWVRRTARPNSAACEHVGDVMNRPATPTVNPSDLGRWPANLAHDGSDEVLEAFAAFGERGGGGKPRLTASNEGRADESQYRIKPTEGTIRDHGDAGTAARFFFSAKASRAERGEGNGHPTVKPLALMQWLVRLITPPGGTVLDPFLGSGSTLIAADREGFNGVGIELSPEYLALARRRIEGDAGMFAEVA